MARPKEFDRSRALNKAMQVFWCKGYEATSMQDLVDGMSVNRQSIYDTFGDKQALFIAALQHYELVEGAKILEALQQPGSAKEAIRHAFQLVLTRTEQERQLGCFMVNSTLEMANYNDTVAELVKSNLKASEGLFYQVLLRGQQQGEFSETKDLKALAAFLANSFRGLRVTSKVVTDLPTLENIVKVTLSVLD